MLNGPTTQLAIDEQATDEHQTDEQATDESISTLTRFTVPKSVVGSLGLQAMLIDGLHSQSSNSKVCTPNLEFDGRNIKCRNWTVCTQNHPTPRSDLQMSESVGLQCKSSYLMVRTITKSDVQLTVNATDSCSVRLFLTTIAFSPKKRMPPSRHLETGALASSGFRRAGGVPELRANPIVQHPRQVASPALTLVLVDHVNSFCIKLEGHCVQAMFVCERKHCVIVITSVVHKK